MSLLNFFRRKDPTADWPACTPVPLHFDVGRGELNGIPFGSPMAALRTLGRPSSPHRTPPHPWSYPSLGLEVVLDAAKAVSFFTCVLKADEDETDLSKYPDFQPCRVRLRFAEGEELEITADTPRADIEAALGPLTREGEAVGGMDTVTYGGAWFGFSFDPAGRWTLLDIEPTKG